MKLIIAGSRHANVGHEDIAQVLREIGWEPTEIVSGGSGNVDKAGEHLSECLRIPKRVFIAYWSEHGLAAGPIRNQEMAKYADRLLAFWDGKSRGTKNMIETMRRQGKPAYEVEI